MYIFDLNIVTNMFCLTILYIYIYFYLVFQGPQLKTCQVIGMYTLCDINVGVQKKWYGSVTVRRIDGAWLSCVIRSNNNKSSGNTSNRYTTTSSILLTVTLP